MEKGNQRRRDWEGGEKVEEGEGRGRVKELASLTQLVFRPIPLQVMEMGHARPVSWHLRWFQNLEVGRQDKSIKFSQSYILVY